MIDPELLDLLVCPVDHGDVGLDADRVVCAECGRAYPIVDGIPVMLAERAGGSI